MAALIDLLREGIVHLELVCYTLATVFSLLAYREYRGTPWGSVIAAVAVFSGALLVWAFGVWFADALLFSALAWFVASLAVAYAAVQYYRIGAGRVVVR
ncbi:hypothetical protein [Salarchaeum sp. JOR-1]|uniref:hypothetical protein n=1 Tax=Salarchaeum sp. JOR-1 TaxID=2599399 RepID=UPI001198BC70|nr:hypothetical protein [Salarchaeum sp. JOR-1]QDX40364.1 hypothetical protein FQU85_05425 [Salarchaeum sp. JOR-1]